MKRFSTKIIIVSGLVIVVILVAASLIYRIIDSGIQSAVEHKSAKTTTATVVSNIKSVSRSVDGSTASQEFYTICFILDGLDQIEPDMRRGYEEAERHRQENKGPRCKMTDKMAAAALKKGDKLNVKYLLANDYQIEIMAIKAFGVDFGAEGVSYSGSGVIHH
jgi:hypothetical protein